MPWLGSDFISRTVGATGFISGRAACGSRILVPRTGIEPMPLAVEAWSLNHWTAREVPGTKGLKRGNGMVIFVF